MERKEKGKPTGFKITWGPRLSPQTSTPSDSKVSELRRKSKTCFQNSFQEKKLKKSLSEEALQLHSPDIDLANQRRPPRSEGILRQRSGKNYLDLKMKPDAANRSTNLP